MINKNLYKPLLLIFLVIGELCPVSAQEILNSYITEGLKNNIVLKQKNIEIEQAVYSLQTATSYFLPNITLHADFTSGEGGREISIPVGDMLNPVYSTLNQLTQSNAFPQISNVSQDFFPNKFYDVKIRTTLPLLNTDLIYNRQIKKSQVEIQQVEEERYKKELIKEIKVAYYNFLSALSAVKIYENAFTLVAESKRVNESLLANGSGLPVYLLRSESDLENVKAKIVEAENTSRNAKRYFNFLLNRDIEAEVIIDTALQVEPSVISQINSYEPTVKREEILQLENAVEINNSVVSMNKLFWVPKINVFLDLGAQDQIWNLKKESKYYLMGIQLSVPVFEGFRNQYKIEESLLESRNSELNLQLVTRQLNMSSAISKGNLQTAIQNLNSSDKTMKTAGSYFSLVNKGYKEGVNTFIETVDARIQFTQAELSNSINKYKLLIALAEYERETGINLTEIIKEMK